MPQSYWPCFKGSIARGFYIVWLRYKHFQQHRKFYWLSTGLEHPYSLPPPGNENKGASSWSNTLAMSSDCKYSSSCQHNREILLP